MNPVGELLHGDNIMLDFDAPDERAVLAVLASLLARHAHVSEADILAALIVREQIGSTALGHGVAFPHARMPECAVPAAALVRTRLAVPFAAPDARPVSVFLGLVVPQRATQRHLQILAAAAAMFSDQRFREKAKTCDSDTALRRLVASWPDLRTPPQASS